MILREALTPDMNKKLITKFQSVTDIAGALLQAEIASQKDWPVLRKKFKAATEYETCCNIYNWMQKNIRYYKEPKEEQNAKTISRIVHDGYGDCKSFATFAVGAARACGIPAIFRLASFNRWQKDPTHIYALAFPDDKKLTMDGVLLGKPIGSEAKFNYAYNLKPLTPR